MRICRKFLVQIRNLIYAAPEGHRKARGHFRQPELNCLQGGFIINRFLPDEIIDQVFQKFLLSAL